MSRAQQTVKVRPVAGEPFTFDVESWSEPRKPHRVDLIEHAGNGACSCKYFATTCMKNHQANGGRIIPYEKKHPTICRHITAARFYLLNAVLREAAARQPEQIHA